jgi:hypothetical protein
MPEIDPDKLEAALEQLKAEKARRLQARVDSGEIVSIQTVVVVGPDEDEEEATARAIAKHPAPDDGRAVHREFFYIFTGVPRAAAGEAEPAPQIQNSEEAVLSSPSPEQAAGGPPLSHSQPTPTYVRITTSNGSEDGDPGAISEAWFTIEDGLLLLRDSNDKLLTSRAMLAGEDPAVLARSLLHELEKPKDFNRVLNYPKMGFA